MEELAANKNIRMILLCKINCHKPIKKFISTKNSSQSDTLQVKSTILAKSSSRPFPLEVRKSTNCYESDWFVYSKYQHMWTNFNKRLKESDGTNI